MQIDGNVEGQIEATKQIKISVSGNVQGEINTDRLIINGRFEGICRANYIEILSCGCVSGTVYSDNLSIEPGGKFTGITNPSEQDAEAPEPFGHLSSIDNSDDLKELDHNEDKIVLMSQDKNA